MSRGRVLVVDDSATVRNLVRMVLDEAGFTVSVAADGQAALEMLRRASFDVALVDYVMPKLNGYQLSIAVRSFRSPEDLAIVLMSAKADQVAERFMRQTGAVDAISKPFAPDAIVAVVSHAVARRTGGAVAPTLVREELERSVPPAANVDLDDGSVEIDLDLGNEVATENTATPDAIIAQAAATDRVCALLASAITPAVANAVANRRAVDERLVREAIEQAIGPAELLAIARELRGFDDGARDRPALEGQLAKVPIGEVLQMLRLQGQTGVITIERSRAAVSIAMRNGNIDVALARGISPEFLLGRYVVADGKRTRAQIDQIIATRDVAAGHLGEQLVRDGVLTTEDLDRILMRQTCEILYELVRWETGTFRFEPGELPPEADSARLGLPVESILLEAFRRVDEWRLIEDQLSFEQVLVVDTVTLETVGDKRLTKDERAVLAMIDGRRTVRDVVQAVAMSSFDACKAMYGLVKAKLVRKRAG